MLTRLKGKTIRLRGSMRGFLVDLDSEVKQKKTGQDASNEEDAQKPKPHSFSFKDLPSSFSSITLATRFVMIPLFGFFSLYHLWNIKKEEPYTTSFMQSHSALAMLYLFSCVIMSLPFFWKSKKVLWVLIVLSFGYLVCAVSLFSFLVFDSHNNTALTTVKAIATEKTLGTQLQLSENVSNAHPITSFLAPMDFSTLITDNSVPLQHAVDMLIICFVVWIMILESVWKTAQEKPRRTELWAWNEWWWSSKKQTDGLNLVTEDNDEEESPPAAAAESARLEKLKTKRTGLGVIPWQEN
eukprot:TRINITY_DN616_c0_g1_i1.p1 TRINITY_DN616_c0_g1~~TRINITY_DN616_c0_g1_i1.p1  ORF type:complete len:297 (-),score=60.00 TRINITY_DN616_c0_g1_i1:344-1234(-)